VLPEVGFAFEHFGESYRITADRDTVTAINDYGTVGGLTVRTVGRPESRFEASGAVQWGNQTGRLALDFDGRLVRGANTFELRQEGTYRRFHDSGDYAISSDYVREYLRAEWTRGLAGPLALRLGHTFDGTWYATPDRYNLDTVFQEPRAELRFRTEDLNEVRAGYRFGRRTVPDSTTIGYDRHVVEAEANWLFGWTSALDVANRLERRIYDPASVRESSWENRIDARFELSTGQWMTYRLVHANEIARFDELDTLAYDYDYDWARTGVQIEVHRTESLDLSVMPVYAFLASGTAPAEEYSETGLEFGVDWRLGRVAWMSLTNEVGRRDYELSATDAGTADGSLDGVLDQLAGDSPLDFAYSDYVYYRLTLLFTADLPSGFSANLFVNWQPEDHNVSRHDTNSRIISGGIEYRL
jgi:hypothetical protein